MTHFVNGNIIVHGRFLEYDVGLTNNVVIEFLRKNDRYVAKYDKYYGTTEYSRDGESQPFISVQDKAIELFEYNPNLKKLSLDEHLSLIITIGSGSHVGIQDTEYAQEIYDTTVCLRRLLQKRLPLDRKLDLLFDDERQLYLPSTFKKLIRQAAAEFVEHDIRS